MINWKLDTDYLEGIPSGLRDVVYARDAWSKHQLPYTIWNFVILRSCGWK